MTPVTSYVPRARRSARRQGVLACAYSAYLVGFAAAVLALASLALPTGGAALAAAGLFGVLVATAAGLWALDAVGARREPAAAVTRLAAPAPVFSLHRHSAAR